MSDTAANGAAAAGRGADDDDAAGIVVSAGGAPAGRAVTDLVTLLTDRALALSVESARAPSSVRISANAVEVEICWPAVPATAAAMAELPGRAVADVPAAAAGAGPDGDARPGVFPLCAETVGTFYRAAEPGAAPFVSEGARVQPGQQVAIIEAMKLMIPVTAGRAGQVVEFLVTDRSPVEYGQPLMLLREAGQ
jgi:acetyl-CoA carboxylase biotin carboxyl carrier protein